MLNNLNRKITTLQWSQLTVLGAVHFFVDMIGGMIPAIIPAIMSIFSLNLTLAVSVLAAFNLSANSVQLIIGHVRENKKKPLFLYLSIVLAYALLMVSILPYTKTSFPLLLLFAIISGSGVAMAHPEGLRAVHALRRIEPALSTTVFLTPGFFGYAIGGLVSASMVSALGLKGLLWLFILPPIGILVIRHFRIRLATEHKNQNRIDSHRTEKAVNFWLIMAMAAAIASSSTIVVGLLPTRLYELGFKLTFGGFSTMVFGLSAAAGSFFWAFIARKKNELTAAIIGLILGIPFLVLYVFTLSHKLALFALVLAGFGSAASYPLMVTMARHAKGLNLGQRMAFVVGGAWGLGSIMLMAMGPVAEYYSIQSVMNFTPLGYLIAAFIGLAAFKKGKANK